MTERMLRVEVQRYLPNRHNQPVWTSYEVPSRPDWLLLDVLHHIKDYIDSSLSYRWSCQMAVCGSCGMMVNDDPVLACKTFVRDLPDDIRIAPLANIPVVRDLVSDMDGFTEKLASTRPYVISDAVLAETETNRQSPAQLDAYRQYTMCINCLLCYAACPQVGLNADYIGPAALTLAHRYNLDSRDAGQAQREPVTASEEGVWECTFVGECSAVCPNDVDPAGAIQQMKIASSVEWLKDLLLPRGSGT